MPRLLYWNVQHFSEDKFFVRRRKRKRDDDEAWGENAAQNYLDVLFNTITAHNPDFVVIVEARPAGHTGRGTLLSDDGSMRLLRYLRNNDTAAWALVPPLISGSGNAGEGIGVYFRRTATRYFTGPWRWPGGWGPAAAGGALGLYPAQYRFAFSQPVDNRVLPAGNNLYNAGRVERRLAGQWRYYPGGGGGGGGAMYLRFGGVGKRAPFRTTFYDSAAALNYTIVSCHNTPSQDGGLAGVAAAPSTLGAAAIGNLHEVQNIGANERIVVVGDFNVSLFDAAATGVAYAPFAAAYTRVFDWNAGHVMPGYPSRGYLVTHMKPIDQAEPDDTDGYPAFGYGSVLDQYGQYDSIDNAFVRGSAPANATIANIVAGAPYTAVAAPADVPVGHYAYPSVLASPAALNVPNGYNPNGMNYDDEVRDFREIDNYALAYGVSDHLPLVFDF